MKKLYVFGWLSNIGGADTRLIHTLQILSKYIDVTMVPNHDMRLGESMWTKYMDSLNVKYSSWDRITDADYGLVIGNKYFYENKFYEKLINKGMYFISSNDMMYPYPNEVLAIHGGYVDHILYNSKFNEEGLKPYYSMFNIPSSIIENYINETEFPYIVRPERDVTVGRLSRNDPDKYSSDFKEIYESIDYAKKFKVMAWGPRLDTKFAGYNFDDRWQLMGSCAQLSNDFLQSLDIFLYTLDGFKESWGRSVVEAMLTGLPVITPNGHNFENMIDNGVNGFVCSNRQEISTAIEYLRSYENRQKMGYEAQKKARELCDLEKHTTAWRGLFNV